MWQIVYSCCCENNQNLAKLYISRKTIHKYLKKSLRLLQLFISSWLLQRACSFWLISFFFPFQVPLLSFVSCAMTWLLCCPSLGLNRKKLSAGVSFSWQKHCCHMHKCRGRLLLGEKVGLRVKLTVKSCADHQGVKSSYFNFCMFLKGFGLTLWGR